MFFVLYNRLMLNIGHENFVAQALNKAKSYIYIYIYRKHNSGQRLKYQNINSSLYSNLSFHSSSRSRSRFTHYIKWLSNWRKAAYTSTILLLLTILAILCPISFKAADNLAEAASGTPKQSTLTFAYVDNKSTASVSLNVSDPNGTFATSNDNEKAAFTLSTDNYTGYTLRLKTTGATTLTDGTNTIESIPTDGITSSSTAWNTNRWGLLPSYYNSSSNTANYYRATTDGFLMEQTSSANSTPKQYTVGMGLKADYNTPAGTYTSSAIVAEYVARPISYSIAYDKGNISGTPSNIPAVQSDLISSTSVTLSSTTPSITGYNFTGWCLGTVSTNTTTKVDSCTGTGSKTFQPGASFGIDQTISNDVTLHAMWSAIPRTITITAGAGVSTLALSGWTGTGTATMTKTYYTGDTINLSTITPTYKTAYSGVAYTKTDSATGSSISGSTYTVGSGNGAITLKATTLAQPTCTMTGGTTKVYNRSATTLTATDNAGNYDTTSADITYSFGYASSSTADLANFGAAQTGNTLSIAKAAYRGSRYYGVTVVVTDKTDSSITSTCTSGTGTGTGTTVAARATMSLVNSRIDFNATNADGSLTGTLSGTSPVYVYYQGTASYSSRTGTTARAIPTATPPSGYTFDGWSTSAGVKVINADGSLVASVASWTDSSNRWVKTGTSNTAGAAANQLYAVYKTDLCKNKTSLYDLVSCRSKGTQTAADLQATITTANSGVYEYNASVFGTASDAANTSKIYYYRGILDETVGSYGSDGDGRAYPNYVILQAGSSKATTDTCWRIVRTTGSGGVKMIYNGKWTGSTCANATTNAQVTTQAFGLKGNSGQSAWYKNINRVGYTFNNTQSLQDSTTATNVNTVFGSDSSPSTNNARSNIKTYIEDTWYASNMTAWTSKLEASAGYCNDRTAFSNDTGATALTTIKPYATSSAAMYFGAYARNMNSAKTPSLTCPRSTVDLYRYVSGSTGVSNQLKYPVALITADEASFAGSGSSTATNGSSYNANSYLRSGSVFWLLSPRDRDSLGNVRGFYLVSNGYLFGNYVDFAYGVRPVISLVSGTTPTGGSGIATDPWVVRQQR